MYLGRMKSDSEALAGVSSKVIRRPRLYECFRQSAERFQQCIALKGDGGRGRSYTYAEIDRIVCEGAPILRALGQPLIAIISENRPEWPIAYLSIVAAGKTVVPIDPHLKPNEIAAIIRHSGVTTMFASEKLAPVLENLGLPIRVLSLESGSDTYWLRQVSAANGAAESPANPEAALIYTSGTTGDPKAVILTHENLAANLDGIADAFHFTERDVFLSVLPLHHAFEATCGFLTPLMCGCCVVYARSFKSKEILEDLAANSVTIMCGVPLLFEKMYHSIRRGVQQAPLSARIVFWTLFGLSWFGRRLRLKWGRTFFSGFRRKTGLHSIRMFVSGGAALPKAISQFYNLIGFEFLQGYGMTECSPVVTINRVDDNRFGSVGRPLKNVEVRIDKPDRDGIGEICVRGNSVTPGYKGNPIRTAELIRDGWLYSGDLGRFDKGHLWITGRAKNVIVSAAGKNIYPEELEERLLDSPFVLEALVVGRSRSGGKQGEEVFAIIVPDLDQMRAERGIDPKASDSELVQRKIGAVIAEVNAGLADYKRITGFDLRFAELEKTASKKVKRFLYAQGNSTFSSS